MPFKGIRISSMPRKSLELPAHHLSNPSLAVTHATSTYHYLSTVGGDKKQITALGEAAVSLRMTRRPRFSASWTRQTGTEQIRNGAVTDAVLGALTRGSAHFAWRWRERPALALLVWEACSRSIKYATPHPLGSFDLPQIAGSQCGN